jgi:beta-1,4-mannosyltransferase
VTTTEQHGEMPSCLVVLESFGPPHRRTNPYLVQLMGSFPDWVRARHFSWRDALLGRWDVFHLHWPEVLLRGSSPVRTAARCVAFALVLLRIRLGHRALVRTVHNLTPHEPPNRVQRALIDLSERWTTVWITLSDRIAAPRPGPTFLAPIGHYRGWFGTLPEVEPVRGRLVQVGQIRPYKGSESLVEAVARIEDAELSLHLVGEARDPGLRDRLMAAASADPRIRLLADHVDDDVLLAELLAAELVVLPFTAITNSSSLVLALSLERPVLVPAAPATAELAEEVGPGWVHRYHGPLDPATITRCLAALRSSPPTAPPSLGRRDWPEVGAAHAHAFRLAAATKHRLDDADPGGAPFPGSGPRVASSGKERCE